MRCPALFRPGTSPLGKGCDDLAFVQPLAVGGRRACLTNNSQKITREMYIDSRRWKRIKEGRMGPQRANETSVHRNHSHFRPKKDGNPASCPHIRHRISVNYCAYLKPSVSVSPLHRLRWCSHSLPRPLPGSRFISCTISLVELYRGQRESR